MTFQIITDSTADLDPIWAKENDVLVLGLTINLEGQTYETVGQHRLTSEVLLERMKNGEKPTTSQINVGTFEETFRELAVAGTDILYLAFSSVLSGTYQSAVMARDVVLEEFPDARIEIIDTLAAAGGEGYLSMVAVEKRDQGLELDRVMAAITDILPRLRTFFLVDDLHHLMRGGRLSKSTAIIGSLVNIKPLLWLDTNGKLVPLTKTRGRKKGIRELVARAVEDLGQTTAIVAHANDPEAASLLEEQLLANKEINKVVILPLGPVIASHVGPGTLAVFTVGNNPR